jgi:hypothetical protein
MHGIQAEVYMLLTCGKVVTLTGIMQQAVPLLVWNLRQITIPNLETLLVLDWSSIIAVLANTMDVIGSQLQHMLVICDTGPATCAQPHCQTTIMTRTAGPTIDTNGIVLVAAVWTARHLPRRHPHLRARPP